MSARWLTLALLVGSGACSDEQPAEVPQVETPVEQRPATVPDPAATEHPSGVRIMGAQIPVPPPGARMGAAYFTIVNGSDQEERLLRVSTSVAERTEIHDLVEEGDTVRMVHLTDGVPLPAGGRAVLDPGGMHIMLLGLSHPLEVGETAPFVLELSNAGRIELSVPVRPRE